MAPATTSVRPRSRCRSVNSHDGRCCCRVSDGDRAHPRRQNARASSQKTITHISCSCLTDDHGAATLTEGREKLVTMRLIRDDLRELPLFSGASRAELVTIGSQLTELHVPAGKVLVHEGALGDEFMILLEGEAVVTQHGRPIATLGRGDLVGEMALLQEGGRGRRNATVTARDRRCGLRGLAERVPTDPRGGALRRRQSAADRRSPDHAPRRLTRPFLGTGPIGRIASTAVGRSPDVIGAPTPPVTPRGGRRYVPGSRSKSGPSTCRGGCLSRPVGSRPLRLRRGHARSARCRRRRRRFRGRGV